MKCISFILIFFMLYSIARTQETEIIYLSGTGFKDEKLWNFYCSDGMNSKVKTTIPVPSCWELQGFGKYNYGLDKDEIRGKEIGYYNTTFYIPRKFKDKQIFLVFDGIMTDAEVKVNGKLTGPIHKGGFYRFKYNITNLIKYDSENTLDVKVWKHSSDESVNKAERFADYWIFGGIYRPVYLEIKPSIYIDKVFIDAKANGKLNLIMYISKNLKDLQIFYTLKDKKKNIIVHKSKLYNFKINENVLTINDSLKNIIPWNPEFPYLYELTCYLIKNQDTIHNVKHNIGFRTIEVMPRDGIYLNGVKIKFKGINRHDFWPESGRTLNKEICINDALLIKEMNMNAVRCSHYPPDERFIDACDSLGILVLNELAGWHDAYSTEIGANLVREMIETYCNHPSIIMWVNGNEGGHNHELLPYYQKYDIQKRPVIHAWEVFNNMDTQHYINYDYGNGTHFQGREIFFPTEFLHGLYDGGHGAGLYDYWEAMWRNPLSAGGFLWNLSDEGIVRVDKNYIIDTDGNHGADGITGPFREKEGSYFTVKEVWAPIYFEPKEITQYFDGTFKIENRFFYTNLNQCKFTWKLVKTSSPWLKESVSINGIANIEDIKPFEKGYLKINLPKNWYSFDFLYITAYDPYNKEIYTWSWPIKKPSEIANQILETNITTHNKIKTSEQDSILKVEVDSIKLNFNLFNGTIISVSNRFGEIPLKNGPILYNGEYLKEKFNYSFIKDTLKIFSTFKIKSGYRYIEWSILPSGWVKLYVDYCPIEYESDYLGISFYFQEKDVKKIEWLGKGPYRVWKNRIHGTTYNVWTKEYNNTVTGIKDFIYPEFKGYHANLYWFKLYFNNQFFSVVCNDEDIFLRLFTPEKPETPFNTYPLFPIGDISFLHGIPPIGTKSQKPENMGPSGRKNMFYTYGNTRCKSLTLFFDFSGKF